MSEASLRKIYLIRHTTPKIEKGFIYGQTDLDVMPSFKEEFEEIRELVPQHADMPLYSSPLTRCRKLAEALQGQPLTFDERIKEMNFGDWEMTKWDELDPRLRNHWLKNIETIAPPNGESNTDLKNRSIDFWDEIQKKQYKEVGLVTHYGIIQSLLSHLLHIPIAKSHRLDINYGAVIQITVREEEFFKIKFLR